MSRVMDAGSAWLTPVDVGAHEDQAAGAALTMPNGQLLTSSRSRSLRRGR